MEKRNMLPPEEEKRSSAGVLFRIIVCVLILGVGVAGFLMLKKMKKPPVEVERSEQRIKVDAVQVQPEDVPVSIQGYGEVTSRTIVALSAEVAGRVVAVHPRLEAGEIINAGDVLFRIDDRDMQTELKNSRTRLTTLKRDEELSTREFKRAKKLLSKNKVGSLGKVEQLERAMNAVVSQINQVERTLELTETRLSRTVVRAPFLCRLKKVDVEKDQYVTPGKPVLVIIDDSQLEIQVPIDSRDASRWLRLQDKPKKGSWFGHPEPVKCPVLWVEDERVSAEGVLDRIVGYTSSTRTMKVAVRIDTPASGRVDFPLTEGMFCKVTIPGRTLIQVFPLPRWAVSFENIVSLVVDNRLQTTSVTVARREDEVAYVESGLKPGDIVITTRLNNSLEKSLLDVHLGDREEQ